MPAPGNLFPCSFQTPALECHRKFAQKFSSRSSRPKAKDAEPGSDFQPYCALSKRTADFYAWKASWGRGQRLKFFYLGPPKSRPSLKKFQLNSSAEAGKPFCSPTTNKPFANSLPRN